MVSTNPHNTFGKGLKARAVNGGSDNYFTKPEVARELLAHLRCMMRKWRISKPTFVEPSAGNGVWLDALPANTEFLAYDIEPQHPAVCKADFYKIDVPDNSIVIGNPPFGFAAKEAINFFNHAARSARIVLSLSPNIQKQSVQRKLHPHFHLEYEQDLDDSSFTVDGVDRSVPSASRSGGARRRPAPSSS